MILTKEQAVSFDADSYTNPIIGISIEMGQHDSGTHSHGRHQLLSSASGCITVEVENSIYVLPPHRAAWIPAHTLHRATMRGVIAYRSLYFLTSIPRLDFSMQIIETNPLLFQVIERMASWSCDMPVDKQLPLTAVFREELNHARRENLKLRYPQDKRLRTSMRKIFEGELPPRLGILALQVGACERTISRIFIKDTGMSYQNWRQQWRLLKAIESLAEGKCLSQIAQELEFSSDSAFIAFFNQHTGSTPSRYFNFK
ncbi:AraC family transcriptional regulator [Enterobacter bugandensis]|uniref:AraC family transcriptional regulator n=1 Tax=Enterobacter bugandensis TaxID=881260 RepID=UPI0013D1143E|nr:helix-turn-helix transcriptional regulator [Enterobacter bugandensis]